MTTLNDLTDVTITSPQEGQRLVYDGSQWINKTVDDWVRNPSWLPLTEWGTSEQGMRGLLAVYPESTYVAFAAQGAYTVNWGDGATENVNSNVQAQRLYDFNDPDLDGTNAPVTLTDSTDRVERTAHGYTNGDTVTLYNVTGSTGVQSGQVYFVINATANDFQVSATRGGSAINLAANGTATLLPYKQAIVTVTPNGGNITVLDLNRRHSAMSQAYETGWLDLEIGSPNFTTTGLTIRTSSETVRMRMVERIRIANLGGTTSLVDEFNSCMALQSVILPSTASVTNWLRTFNACRALKIAPVMDTSGATSMMGMFSSCTSLLTVPLYNTAAVTSMVEMFVGCLALQTVPRFNTSLVNNMNTMFSSCNSLQSLPQFDTSGVTNVSNMLFGCASLQSVPAFNLSAVSSSVNFNNFVVSNNSIARFQATGMAFTFSVQNCKLGATQLNEIYTNLPTVVGQTITVTNNFGIAGHDPSIAQAKGWTVAV